MTKFADQLYADLMREHESTLAATSPPAESRRQLASRRVLLATGAGGLAVAATAGVLAAGGGNPAYALTTSHDGAVTLAVYRAAGISQANAKLHQLGDRVVVVPIRAGCPAVRSLPPPPVLPNGKISVQSTKSSGGSVTVHAPGVPAGDVLVVFAEITAHGTQLGASLTSAPAPNCVSLSSSPSGSGSHVAHRGGSGQKVHRAGSGPNVAVRRGTGPASSGRN